MAVYLAVLALYSLSEESLHLEGKSGNADTPNLPLCVCARERVCVSAHVHECVYIYVGTISVYVTENLLM